MEYVFLVLSLISIFAVLASSLNLVTGFGGLLSVAHAAFFGLGAYAFALATTQLSLPFLPALLVAFVVAGIGSLTVSAPSLRVSGDYLLLATFAVQVLASSLFLNLPITGGPAGIRGIPSIVLPGLPARSGAATFVACLAIAVVCCSIMWTMARSPFGRVLKAIREDEVATLALGKDVVRFKVAVFGVGCAFAGLAGGLYAALMSFINPDSFTIYASFTVVIMILLGGLANPLGGLVGAAVLITLQEALRLVLPTAAGTQLAQVAFGAILVGVVLWRPQGLVPEHRAGGRREHDTVRRDSGAPPPLAIRPRPVVAGPLLDVRGLRKSFGGVQAVRGASFAVNGGEIVGIIGPNGAGKTTLFDMLNGLVRPGEGEVLLGGTAMAGKPAWRFARGGIGRLFQDARPLANMTVLDNVLVACDGGVRENPWLSWLPIGRDGERARLAQAEACLGFIGLSAHAGERAGSLSYGQQKLLGFARLLAQGASIWLLDEPAAGIDPAMREAIRSLLRKSRDELGVTIVVVEHAMDFLAGLVDRVIFMAEGRVLKEGDFATVTADPELNRLYLGA